VSSSRGSGRGSRSRFAPVEALLAQQSAGDDPGSGAAVAVYVDGRCVVDACAGDATTARPWTRRTRAVGWSVTKGIVAAGVQLLNTRGKLDVDARVAERWPEFAACGKGEVRIRDVLAHMAGLPCWAGFERVARLEGAWGWDDPRAIAASLAAAAPVLTPCSVASYHNFTVGWLIDEILLRFTGRSARRLVNEELAPALGLNLGLGVVRPRDRERLARIVVPYGVNDPRVAAVERETPLGSPAGDAALRTAAAGALYRGALTANHPRFLATGQAACGAVTDAHSLARLYGTLAHRGRLDGRAWFSVESIAAFAAPAWHGTDPLRGTPISRSLAYQLPTVAEPMAPAPGVFGHNGWGGSSGLAVPAAGMGFGYVTNRMDLVNQQRRSFELVQTALRCL
jgi:CubicO group peptidase (beta-lactamase class C family)